MQARIRGRGAAPRQFEVGVFAAEMVGAAGQSHAVAVRRNTGVEAAAESEALESAAAESADESADSAAGIAELPEGAQAAASRPEGPAAANAAQPTAALAGLPRLARLPGGRGALSVAEQPVPVLEGRRPTINCREDRGFGRHLRPTIRGCTPLSPGRAARQPAQAHAGGQTQKDKTSDVHCERPLERCAVPKAYWVIVP
jgi:hypothetical protein